MKKLTMALLASIIAIGAQTQQASPQEDSWHIGVAGGYHASKLNYNNLDESIFPKSDFRGSEAFSIFLRKSFGQERHFAIRPEFSILNRGGRLSNIYDYGNYYEKNNLKNYKYRIKAHYIDFRLPLMWQFGHNGSNVRPYLFVAPVVGLCTGGNINLQRDREVLNVPTATNYDGVCFDITKANINELYIAGAAGAGLNWYFNVNNRHRCFLGLEANYEHGITDTYGKENDADIKVIVDPNGNGNVEGKRHMIGYEVKLTLGIPFTVFTRAKSDPEYFIEEVVIPIPSPEPEAPVTPKYEKPCYSLDEIATMMARGESIEGKKICAIDDMVNFEFGKSVILPESYPYLDRLAEMLKRANSYVRINGHTDNVGEVEYNLRLSRDRAMAVYNYLIERGVSAERLSYAYYGMAQPLTSNDTEEGRRLNRRVEFEILH